MCGFKFIVKGIIMRFSAHNITVIQIGYDKDFIYSN